MPDVSMDRTERFYLIGRLLKQRRSVNTTQLLQALDVSRATLMRDLAYMRDRMRTPIVFDADLGGYRLDLTAGERSELPGMWFNASEAQALLAMLQLLRDIEPGVLAAHVAPLQQRLQALIGEGDVRWDELFTVCETVGGTEWYVVEQESYPFPPMDCIRRCRETLRGMGR